MSVVAELARGSKMSLVMEVLGLKKPTSNIRLRRRARELLCDTVKGIPPSYRDIVGIMPGWLYYAIIVARTEPTHVVTLTRLTGASNRTVHTHIVRAIERGLVERTIRGLVATEKCRKLVEEIASICG